MKGKVLIAVAAVAAGAAFGAVKDEVHGYTPTCSGFCADVKCEIL